MTSLQSIDVRCAHCGTTVKVPWVASTNSFGAPDMDLRPAPMARHTLSTQVQRCPGCGYCAPQINLPPGPQAARFLQDVGAAALVTDPDHATHGPALAQRFALAAHLQRLCGQHDLAGWSAMRAAWACDDIATDLPAGTQAARRYRVMAAESFSLAEAQGLPTHGEPLLGRLVQVDLWRRARRYPQAMTLAEASAAILARHPPLPELGARLRTALDLQARWARAEDDQGHRLDEADRAPTSDDGTPAAPPALPPDRLARLRAQDEARRGTAPARTVEAMIAARASGQHLSEDAARALLDELPMPARHRGLLRAHMADCDWPATATLAGLLLALLPRPGMPAMDAGRQADWHARAASVPGLVAYLAHCLRGSTSAQWHCTPPPAGTGPLLPLALDGLAQCFTSPSRWTSLRTQDDSCTLHFDGVRLHSRPQTLGGPPADGFRLYFSGDLAMAWMIFPDAAKAADTMAIGMPCPEPGAGHAVTALSFRRPDEARALIDSAPRRGHRGDLARLRQPGPDDEVLALRAGHLGLVVVAREVAILGAYDEFNLVKALAQARRWSTYWRNYWRSRNTARPMPFDPRCEAQPPRAGER